jgi:hypothetical protein
MTVLRSSRANPPSQAARIPAEDPLESERRSERYHPRSQTLTTDPALGETRKNPLALESPSNGQPTTNSPSGGCQPAGSSARNPPIAEDPSGIPVAEGISNNTSSIEELSDKICSQQHGVPTSNSQPVLRLRTLFIAVAALSRLGSAAVRRGTERTINNSIEEINDSNELLSSGERFGNDLSMFVSN